MAVNSNAALHGHILEAAYLQPDIQMEDQEEAPVFMAVNSNAAPNGHCTAAPAIADTAAMSDLGEQMGPTATDEAAKKLPSASDALQDGVSESSVDSHEQPLGEGGEGGEGVDIIAMLMALDVPEVHSHCVEVEVSGGSTLAAAEPISVEAASKLLAADALVWAAPASRGLQEYPVMDAAKAPSAAMLPLKLHAVHSVGPPWAFPGGGEEGLSGRRGVIGAQAPAVKGMKSAPPAMLRAQSSELVEIDLSSATSSTSLGPEAQVRPLHLQEGRDWMTGEVVSPLSSHPSCPAQHALALYDVHLLGAVCAVCTVCAVQAYICPLLPFTLCDA
jgi:hypothetical protein